MKQEIFEHVATVPVRPHKRTLWGAVAGWGEDILAGLALVGLFAIGVAYWVVAS
jgi:hypothetical protein